MIDCAVMRHPVALFFFEWLDNNQISPWFSSATLEFYGVPVCGIMLQFTKEPPNFNQPLLTSKSSKVKVEILIC